MLKWESMVKTVLKKDKAGGFRLPDTKTYYKILLFKVAWYWCKDRYVDQLSRIKSTKKPQTKHI